MSVLRRLGPIVLLRWVQLHHPELLKVFACRDLIEWQILPWLCFQGSKKHKSLTYFVVIKFYQKYNYNLIQL